MATSRVPVGSLSLLRLFAAKRQSPFVVPTHRAAVARAGIILPGGAGGFARSTL